MDVEELRSYLIDYLGSGMIHLSQGMGIIAMGYLGEVENAEPERLIEIAQELGIVPRQ